MAPSAAVGTDSGRLALKVASAANGHGGRFVEPPVPDSRSLSWACLGSTSIVTDWSGSGIPRQHLVPRHGEVCGSSLKLSRAHARVMDSASGLASGLRSDSRVIARLRGTMRHTRTDNYI